MIKQKMNKNRHYSFFLSFCLFFRQIHQINSALLYYFLVRFPIILNFGVNFIEKCIPMNSIFVCFPISFFFTLIIYFYLLKDFCSFPTVHFSFFLSFFLSSNLLTSIFSFFPYIFIFPAKLSFFLSFFFSFFLSSFPFDFYTFFSSFICLIIYLKRCFFYRLYDFFFFFR